MTRLLQLLATPGVDSTLRALANDMDSAHSKLKLEDALHDYGATCPNTVVDELIEANLLQYVGQRVAISKNGRKVQLLIEALNGEDADNIFRRIQRIDGTNRYELVREGMTEQFFEDLTRVNDALGTLYICSPWINASTEAIRNLEYSCIESSKRSAQMPELLLVTRPPTNDDQVTRLDVFREIGAKVYFHNRLHTKLYIREPGRDGGFLVAIVGSQNLTRSRYLELGIRISQDDRMIKQLIQYFMDLISMSAETAKKV